MSVRRFAGSLVSLALLCACGQAPSSAPDAAAPAVESHSPAQVADAAAPPAAAPLPAADSSMAPALSSDLLLDDFATVSGWDNCVDKTATVKLSNAAGENGSALRIDYDLTGGVWLDIGKRFGRSFKPYQGIRFRYKGEGSANSLEFKLEDVDGSTFGTLIATRSNPSAWTTVELPFTQLKYFWGGDQVLDLNDPKMHFAISIKDGDNGGRGKILIERLEFMR